VPVILCKMKGTGLPGSQFLENCTDRRQDIGFARPRRYLQLHRRRGRIRNWTATTPVSIISTGMEVDHLPHSLGSGQSLESLDRHQSTAGWIVLVG
jgi:hypothetical protein